MKCGKEVSALDSINHQAVLNCLVRLKSLSGYFQGNHYLGGLMRRQKMNVTYMYTVLLGSFYFQGGIAFRILWYPFIFMQIAYHVNLCGLLLLLCMFSVNRLYKLYLLHRLKVCSVLF